jgi:hypothetical protein
LGCPPLGKDSVGHDEGVVFVFGDENVGYIFGSTVQEAAFLRFVIEEGSFLQLVALGLEHGHRVVHLSLLLHSDSLNDDQILLVFVQLAHQTADDLTKREGTELL